MLVVVDGLLPVLVRMVLVLIFSVVVADDLLVPVASSVTTVVTG